MKRKLVNILLAFLICACPIQLLAGDVFPTDPFSGQYFESWESFPHNGGEPQTYLSNPTSIMSNFATIANPFMVIYEPGISDFYLGTSGTATVADGIHGMGLNRSGQTAEISFINPISEFGAFWGASTSPFSGKPAIVSVSFFDETNTLIATSAFEYSRPNDGILEWHGWTSTTPIKRLTYTEDFVVIDGLQANPVPEPTTLALLAFAIPLVRRQRRL